MSTELIYDYFRGELDDERKLGVERALEAYPELRQELKRLSLAAQFVQKLNELQPSPELYDLLEKSTAPVKWRFEIPSMQIRLRTLVEASIGAVFVALLIFYVPWQNLGDAVATWKAGSRTQIGDKSEEAALVAENDQLRNYPIDEVSIDAIPVPAPAEEIEAQNLESENQNIIEQVKTVDVASSPQGDSEQSTVTAAQPPSNAEINLADFVVDRTQDNKNPKQKGIVYKVFMNLRGLDAITPQIVADIRKLGGEKAGQVELGWRKERGSYSNFSIPSAKIKELVRTLNAHGDLRIFKDSHEQVTAEGQARFVLWIEDLDYKP